MPSIYAKPERDYMQPEAGKEEEFYRQLDEDLGRPHTPMVIRLATAEEISEDIKRCSAT